MGETPNINVAFDPDETERIGDATFTGPSVAAVMGAGLTIRDVAITVGIRSTWSSSVR